MDPEKLKPENIFSRESRVLLFADVVESVRLFELDEAGTMTSWLSLLESMESEILPPCGGRLVKTLGDGVLIEFQDVLGAVSAAFALQHAANRGNIGRRPELHLQLRIGIEFGEVLVARHDVFGHGVNLAARLSALAGPGEIVVSAPVREQLTSDLDADIEDLGDCYLKHMSGTVRAYRVGPPSPEAALGAGLRGTDLRATLAVVPFSTTDRDPEHLVVGEALAEELIQELSLSPDLNVISRFSTSPFRDRIALAPEIGAHLSADYVLCGRYGRQGAKLAVSFELAEAKSGRIVWTRRVSSRPQTLLGADREFVIATAAALRSAVNAREVRRAGTQSVPTLKSYTLLMAALTLMHRMSLTEFEHARHLLETLIDRGRREPVPQAWLAKWFVLRVVQGWSVTPNEDAKQALRCSRQALESDPDNSLALAVDGLVQTHFMKRLDKAQDRYAAAVARNPNDSLAWALKGTMHAFIGEGATAVDNTQRALRLSPLDPQRYYYDSLAGTALLAAGQYGKALAYAERSLKANRSHTSTLRVATIAACRLGLHDQARAMAQRLLKLEPGLTMRDYLKRSPAAVFPTGKDWAEALRESGVPN